MKKGGLLAVAYINKHFILNSVMLNDKKFMTNDFVDKILKTGVIKEGEKECFWTDAFFTTPDEMETLVSKMNAEVIDHVAADGMSNHGLVICRK